MEGFRPIGEALGSHWTALVKPRVSDEEYLRKLGGRQERQECPLCRGAGMVRREVDGKVDYPPCRCRSESLARSREAYSGLAQIMPSQTFGNFHTTPETQEAYDLARTFAAERTTHHILTLHGGVGTGKTHLLQAIGWVSLEQGRQPKFVNAARYLDDLRATFQDDSPVTFETIYRRLEAAQMLLLDDIGAERLTNWGQEQLYKIVNYRYQERLPMAVSMNLNEKQAVDTYGERTTDRLLDIHSGRVRVVDTGSVSYRTGR